ncbi:dephospho-CoA kinase [Sphingomonas lacunae]|uniref:Dephospho-CoA kinase n=1 Tax=Sphingomonas lacunae TaxID=2698828 RepID=A0A6M4AUW8_9SPHN|nr:dephospho-CoA kinase [Sphingomonas lacunae]QJQ31869.1 dephospho-CoA kinase [Sphingomonas lacunae]
MSAPPSPVDHGRPLLVGLTGSIGMGKSTVAAMMRDEGVAVFDADAEVHRLQAPGGAMLPLIEAAFPGTTGPAGLDRAALGARVFGDDEALRTLERIVHPAVAESQAEFMARHRHDPLVVLDIPLLFEKGGFSAVDRIIVVSAPADVQRERVLARPGMTVEKFEDIVARQTPDADKRARADHVIDTSATLDETRAQLRHVLACLRAERGA